MGPPRHCAGSSRRLAHQLRQLVLNSQVESGAFDTIISVRRIMTDDKCHVPVSQVVSNLFRSWLMLTHCTDTHFAAHLCAIVARFIAGGFNK
jgi:hypothetical protein